MYMFTPKYATYDKHDKEKLKKEISAAYSLGYGGTETNAPAVAARAKVVADITALERAQTILNYVPGNDGTHKYIRDHLVQDRKWLAHWDKCIEQTKKGYEQLVAASKALREEAYNAGQTATEKAFALRMAAERAERVKQQQNKNDSDKSKEFNKDNKGGNNNERRDNNERKDNNGKDNQNKNRPPITIVEKMIVMEAVDGKKGKKNKDKGPKFQQQKHH